MKKHIAAHRKENVVRRIHFDRSTKWTRGTKLVDMSEFKEGADVICFGTYPAASAQLLARQDRIVQTFQKLVAQRGGAATKT